MDYSTITQLIGSYGFPIVACIALYIQMNKMSENHASDMEKMTDAINNNTKVMTRICERLKIDE